MIWSHFQEGVFAALGESVVHRMGKPSGTVQASTKDAVTSLASVRNALPAQPPMAAVLGTEVVKDASEPPENRAP